MHQKQVLYHFTSFKSLCTCFLASIMRLIQLNIQWTSYWPYLKSKSPWICRWCHHICSNTHRTFQSHIPSFGDSVRCQTDITRGDNEFSRMEMITWGTWFALGSLKYQLQLLMKFRKWNLKEHGRNTDPNSISVVLLRCIPYSPWFSPCCWRT